MKKLSLLIILISSLAIVYSQDYQIRQDVIGNLGGHAVGSNGVHMNYTLGEPVSEVAIGAKIIITQGFHQPEDCLIVSTSEVSGLEELKGIHLYPNPTEAIITVEIRENDPAEITGKLFDLTGKELLQKRLDNNKETFNLSNLPAAIYLLHFQNVDGQTTVFKVQKL